jgi:hypothetical protein
LQASSSDDLKAGKFEITALYRSGILHRANSCTMTDSYNDTFYQAPEYVPVRSFIHSIEVIRVTLLVTIKWIESRLIM